MAGNAWFHQLLFVGAWLVCLPRIAAAYRLQHTDSLSAETGPPNSDVPDWYLRDAVHGKYFQKVVNATSDADFTEALRTACELVEDGNLSPGHVERIHGSVRTNLLRFAAVDDQVRPGPCLVPMLVRLMTQAKSPDARRDARETLRSLRSTSAEAEEVAELWDEAERRAAKRLEDAVNGRLATDPEALALAGRFYDSNVTVRRKAPSTTRLPRVFTKTSDVTLRREPMTDLECAQSCVYATELASRVSTHLFSRTNENFRGCNGYVLLGGSRCVLFTDLPQKDWESSDGDGRLRIYPIPSAVQFCMMAKPQNAVFSAENKDNLNWTTVSSCQNALTEQYSSAGAQQVAKLQNPTVVKHVCRAECETLVHRINTEAGFMVSHPGDAQSWCSADLVQLVQAHELQCCGDACGWDPASKTCAGIHLLSKVGQKEWFAECCSPSAVMLGSDRDHMCRSTSKVIWRAAVNPRRELQPGSLEAFQWGEDINPNFGGTQGSKQDQPATTSSASLVVTTPTRSETTPTKFTATTTTSQPTTLTTARDSTQATTRTTRPTTTRRMTSTRSAAIARTAPTEATRQAASALVELRSSRVWQPASDLFQPLPCALRCADPTFMKSALLQCSASASREWVAVAEGVPTCPQAGLLKSEKTASPADCTQLGTSTPGATHGSWQFLPGDKSEEKPHLGLCKLFRSCFQQERKMFASGKAQMSNDTEVLWSRVAKGR